MSLRSQILAHARYRFGAMPEIDAGDVESVTVIIYTDKTGRRVGETKVMVQKLWKDPIPAGVEIAAELDTS